MKNRIAAIVVAIVGAVVVAGLHWFNRSEYGYSYNWYINGNLVGLFFIPMLTIFLVFREQPEKFGCAVCTSGRVWALVAAAFVVLLAMLIPASRMQGFQHAYPWFRHFSEFYRVFTNYPQQNPYITDTWLMFYAELSYGMYLFCWEFFFRGYLLFGLMRSINWWAVLVQAVAFGFLHLGKPTIEVFASFGAGVVLGIIALNAKSFVPGFVLHWAASVIFNLMVVHARPH